MSRIVPTQAQHDVSELRHRQRLDIALKVLRTVSIVLLLAVQVWTITQIRATQVVNTPKTDQIVNNTDAIQKTLKILEDATSPEAQARSQEVLREAIATIGCDNRATLQDLIDQLVSRGILTAGDATLNCPSTTTTTSQKEN